jgi:cyanuric acid amidohydrolase
MKVNVFKLPQSRPDDISALDALIESGELDPAAIVAILGKTEGNGCVNDFTRGFATQTLKAYLQTKIDAETVQGIVYVMSGGTEGVISPHLTVFTREEVASYVTQHWGLVLGTARTRSFLPKEIGSLSMVKTVAVAVEEAIAEAGLGKSDVHFVQIKCPLVTSTQFKQSDRSPIGSRNSYQSMAYSRGASALGVAVALSEVDLAQLSAEDICTNDALYSAVASTSAGVEVQNCEIFVLGNAPTSASSLIISHSVMQHALDVEAVKQAIAQTDQPLQQIVNVFAKAEADPAGAILNRRHTMLDDSDISATRMARAVVGAVIASVTEDPMIYISGGSEHQGPPGGAPVAVISRL